MFKKIILLELVIIILFLGYFIGGFYNVSAVNESPLIDKVLHVVSEKSIKRNSGNVKNPYNINDKSLYNKGFEEYEEMCFQCHGWKGLEVSSTAQGLNPAPPKFPEEELYEFSLEDIFWVTKNGIKMTGMPAYAPTHDDKTIWSIAIFLDSSREMIEEDYKKLRSNNSKESHDYHHGD